jgi:hypothetical protein
MEMISLIILALILVGIIFWLWALIDCITKEPSTGNDKVIWVLVILFLHVFGAIAYVLARRPERIRQLGA